MESTILHIQDAQATNGAALRKFFATHKDGKYELRTKRINKRSDNQNRYYWGCVVALIRDRMVELGNDVDSQLVHDFLKDRFNSKEIFTKDGTVIGCIGDTTTKLSKSDFELYLDKIKEFSATVLEIIIPDPSQPAVMFATYDREHDITLVTD